MIIGVAALGALLVFFVTHADRPLVWLPTGLLLGGAVGNLIDRLRDGAVTDFIELPAWPAFNVADICDHGRRARRCSTCSRGRRASDASCRSRADAAGERLDVFLAGPPARAPRRSG